MARILVADDEPGLREFMADALELDGHVVAQAPDGRAAAKLLDERGFDVVITDLKMPGMDGMALLRKVRAEQPEIEVIVMTAHGTVDTAVEAMKLGAFEYLQKPLSGPDELRLLVAARRRAPRPARSRRGRDAPRRPDGPAADLRRSGDEAGRRRDRQGREDVGDRALARRERHRQGSRRARDPRARPARRASRSWRSTARRCRRRCSRASCSATRRARSPARPSASAAGSSSPTAARSSSTRSASSRPSCRPSCCACCRSAGSSASAAAARSRSTCAGSRRPIAICAR